MGAEAETPLSSAARDVARARSEALDLHNAVRSSAPAWHGQVLGFHRIAFSVLARADEWNTSPWASAMERGDSARQTNTAQSQRGPGLSRIAGAAAWCG